MPEIIDPVFAKTKKKRSFSIEGKRAFWACFRENWVYKFGHKNRFAGINSASLHSMAGRYKNPIPTRFLAPHRLLKIPAQAERTL